MRDLKRAQATNQAGSSAAQCPAAAASSCRPATTPPNVAGCGISSPSSTPAACPGCPRVQAAALPGSTRAVGVAPCMALQVGTAEGMLWEAKGLGKAHGWPSCRELVGSLDGSALACKNALAGASLQIK